MYAAWLSIATCSGLALQPGTFGLDAGCKLLTENGAFFKEVKLLQGLLESFNEKIGHFNQVTLQFCI